MLFLSLCWMGWLFEVGWIGDWVAIAIVLDREVCRGREGMYSGDIVVWEHILRYRPQN